MTKLSDSTIKNLADAIKVDVADHIQGQEEYAEFMYKMFDSFITEKMGQMDEDLKGNIMCFLMDSIYLVTSRV